MDHRLKDAANFQRPDHIDEPLYVVTPVFNPQRFRTRWKLYKEFEQRMLLTQGIVLVTIECSFGERQHVLKKEGENHILIQVKTDHEIWIKENLINVAISRLPADAKYVAWVDADVTFVKHDWAYETIHQLQHYDVVQMFSHVHDIDENNIPYQIHESFMYNYVKEGEMATNGHNGEYYQQGRGGLAHKWHPGFAWAATVKALNHLGGLMDFAIAGAADHHMAGALVGITHRTLHNKVGKEYKDMVREWENRAEKHIKRNVGYVPGLILHYFHGSKKHRRYTDRWKILVENGFTPSLDLKKDWQGVLQLTDRSRKLRDGLRNYFRQRNEDDIYLSENERIL